jgi:hypothetical protein
MAEFMTQDDADKRYGKKGRTNAGLTLGIIGTALAALNNGGGDGCCCSADKKMLMMDNNLQRQLDRKIDGQLKYAYSDLCAPVPNISPLYCSPFTTYGSGTTWTGCCQNSGCQSL